jgi:hypothetical protein
MIVCVSRRKHDEALNSEEVAKVRRELVSNAVPQLVMVGHARTALHGELTFMPPGSGHTFRA